MGVLVHEPRECRYPDPAATAHDPGGARLRAAPGAAHRVTGWDALGHAPLFALRPDRDHTGLHRILAAHVLHRPAVHSLLQHLSRLAALHLSRRHRGHGVAVVLGAPQASDHARHRARALPGRLADALHPLGGARCDPAGLRHHRARQRALRTNHHPQACHAERPHPGRDAGGAAAAPDLHGGGGDRADLPGPRHRLAAHLGHPRQRHAGHHGHHLRLLVPGGALQPGGRPRVRLARPSDFLPLMATTIPAPALSLPAPRQSLWSDMQRRFRRHRLAMGGSLVLALMVVAVLAGPLLYRVPIDEIDFRAKLKGPSWAHPLGTDDLGQDLLARMLYGGRISLAVGVAAMLIAITVGTLLGAVSGYLGGAVDHLLMRITDLFLSLPQLPLLLLIVYLFRDALKNTLGPEAGVFVLIVAVIGGLRWMPVARLVRAQFLSLREKEFVEAARGLGAPPLRQIVRHILPNAMGPVIVAGSLDVATAIIAESTLSFLGLGFPPDIPTWGRILFDAKDNLDFAPHWALFPGTAIILTVLSINYIGDGLRDALDPRRVLAG